MYDDLKNNVKGDVQRAYNALVSQMTTWWNYLNEKSLKNKKVSGLWKTTCSDKKVGHYM